MKALKDIEWSKYSQNGEDGIIDYLVKRLRYGGTRSFVEIGSGSGKQNNTTWLAEQGWSGTVFDRREKRIDNYQTRNLRDVEAICMEVTPYDGETFLDFAGTSTTVFSIDIDSFDYHIVNSLFEEGFGFDIAVVEYNSVFGLDPVTVPYPTPDLVKHFYFGCGVQAWRSLFEPMGYKFVTVDSAGVNAFFVKPDMISDDLDDVEWLPWADCRWATERYGPAEERRKKIADKPLVWV